MCREIAVKTTVANATRIKRLSAVACCVRVVMSRLDKLSRMSSIIAGIPLL